MADTSQSALLSQQQQLLAKGRLSRAEVRELNDIQSKLRNQRGVTYQEAPDYKMSDGKLTTKRGIGGFNTAQTGYNPDLPADQQQNQQAGTRVTKNGYTYEYDAQGGFTTVRRPESAQTRLDQTVALNERINRGDTTVRARDLAYGEESIDLTDDRVQAQAGAVEVQRRQRVAIEKENNKVKDRSPFVYGNEAVASTSDNGFIYQGVSTGSAQQFKATGKETGSNIKSFSFSVFNANKNKSWVDKYNENPLAETGYYDSKINKRNSVKNAFLRFSDSDNNLIDVNQGKTAVQKIQTLPKAEIIYANEQRLIGGGKLIGEYAKTGFEVGKGLFNKANQGLDKIGLASGLYGSIGTSDERGRVPVSFSKRLSIFSEGYVESAGTLAIVQNSGAIVGSKIVRTTFNVAQLGLTGYEGYKLYTNPSDYQQQGRFIVSSTLGVFSAGDIFATNIKPTLVRKIVNREVPDAFLSPKAKLPPPQSIFKNPVFGDLKLNEVTPFDNPMGRTPRERYLETQRRIEDATTPEKTRKSIVNKNIFVTSPDIASNKFIVGVEKTSKANKFVELTTSAQSGVKSSVVGGSPKAKAGVEEDIIFFSAKGYGEPAFLRLGDSGKSEGYSLLTSFGDFFRQPTLFNTKVRGVKNLPSRIRYARTEGIDKANAFYRSVANKGNIFGYNTLRSSENLGKGRASIITVKEDFAFKNGKTIIKGTKMRMGTTKEDEIALGSGQMFKLSQSKGFRGFLANKLFGSTTKRIELEINGEKIPVPIQQGRVLSGKKYNLPVSAEAKSNSPQKLSAIQDSLNSASESYIRARKSVPYSFGSASNLSNISRSSISSNVSRVSTQSRNSNISKVSNLSRTSNVSNVSGVSGASNTSKISRNSNISRNSKVSNLSRISALSRTSSVSKISYLSNTSKPPKIPRINLSPSPRLFRSKSKLRRSTKQYTPSITALFQQRNIFKPKKQKQSTGIGVISGLGVRY